MTRGNAVRKSEIVFCNWIDQEQDSPSLQHELRSLLLSGKAVKAGANWVVRQFHVRSVDQFSALARQWETLYPGHVFFRGQPRDYHESDYVVTKPAALRPARVDWFFSDAVGGDLEQWEETLSGRFGLDCRTGAVIPYREADDLPFLVRLAIDNSPQGRVATNPALFAVLQHYGFPTTCLDVTPDVFVALWFALHKQVTNTSGRISYEPISATSTGSEVSPVDDLRGLPSVYVYVWHSTVVHLTELVALKGIAERPFVQSAASIPCYEFSPTPYGSPGTPRMSQGSHPVEPSAVIKIHFSAEGLHKAKPHMTADSLFPKSDAIYEALMRRNLPHLARYA